LSFKLSTEIKAAAGSLAENSTLLKNGSSELSKEVSMVMEGALELQQSVEEDEEAIADVVTTANRTLLVSGNVEERVRMANVSEGAGLLLILVGDLFDMQFFCTVISYSLLL